MNGIFSAVDSAPNPSMSAAHTLRTPCGSAIRYTTSAMIAVTTLNTSSAALLSEPAGRPLPKRGRKLLSDICQQDRIHDGNHNAERDFNNVEPIDRVHTRLLPSGPRG